MIRILSLLLTLLSLLQLISASALTTTIAANERTCFYASVDKVSEKVSSSAITSTTLLWRVEGTVVKKNMTLMIVFLLRTSDSERNRLDWVLLCCELSTMFHVWLRKEEEESGGSRDEKE